MQAISNKPTCVLEAQPAAICTQAATFSGNPSPTILLQASKATGSSRILPHLQTNESHEEVRSTSQKMEFSTPVSIRPKNIKPAKVDYVPPHLRPAKPATSLTQQTLKEQLQSTTSTTRKDQVHPQLPVNSGEVSALKAHQDQLQSTTPTTRKDQVHPPSPVDTGEVSAPQSHQEQLQSTSPATRKDYVPPHLRPAKIAKVAARQTPKKQSEIKSDPGLAKIADVAARQSPKGKVYSIEEMLEIGSLPYLKKPHLDHAAIMYEILNPSKARKVVNVVPLTKESLVSKTGAVPPASVKTDNTLEYIVSDTGVGILSSDNESPNGKASPDCRNEIAHEDIGLRDWDGSWAPAPCSWENERNSFNNEFIPSYINIWNRGNKSFKSVDTTAERFVSGEGPVDTLHGTLMEIPYTPPAFPDTKNSINVDKQRLQTSETDCRMLIRKLVRDERRRTRWRVSSQEQADRTFEAPPHDLYSPLIPVYLRPARVKDIPGITAIYNHYVQNSIVTEDQHPVSEAQMLEFFKSLRAEFLPFIVAIKGAAPQNPRNVGNEFVVGYSCLVGNFGINTVATRGLRRFTSQIYFFVDPNHLRKGIGRALLDRILSTSTSTHNGQGGYDWVVTEQEAELYNNIGYTGGERRYHQLMIELPIEIKDDRFHPWFKEWLVRKFWFKQVALLDSVARTKEGTPKTRFLDLAIFQMEASIRECYNVNH